MSTSKFMSAPSSNFQSMAMSFVGMMLAVPISLALFSSLQQPALAQQAPTQDDSYARYAEAYAAGYAASGQGAAYSEGCNDVSGEVAAPAQVTATAASYHKTKHVKPMPKHQWAKNVHNSYKKYVSNKYVTNVKNINSNNTVKSSVVVSNSNGAVVSSNTSTSGDNENKTMVNNYKSNNTVASNNVSVDSHDVTIKDSFKHETTNNNTTIIKDSFNKEVNVDVDVKNSGNTTVDKSNHHNTDVDVDLHKKPHFAKS